jgi:tRNA U34 5-methylaminomethyl-2-thiouridine-forming methyltransferase MnmC
MTLRSKIFNTTFHSINGAITERKHIFIEQGMHRALHHTQPVRILELGFGTGLNALLTFKEALNLGISVNYISFDTHPLDMDVFEQLDYSEGDSTSTELFKDIYQAPWNEKVSIHPQLSLYKVSEDIRSISTSPQFHCIYFDPFASDVQPELWETPICQLMHKVLKPGGVLVTWSVKGTFRRALSTAGFSVQKVAGPAGKREITFALKNQ